MMRRLLATLIAALLLPVLAAAGPSGPPSPGPQGPEHGAWRHQLWFIPLPGERLLMHAVVMRPPGPGPFPLVVINHGSIQSAEIRARYPLHEYPIVSHWFLNHGFAVVLPLRGGHGETGGPYYEDQGRCGDAHFRRAGERTAYSIQAAITYMTAQPFVRRAGVVVVGQSAGSWGALALASRNPPSVGTVINFAGGRGGRSENIPNNNCSPDRLLAAAADFGRTARVPTLWIYAANDTYFAPALSKRLYSAYHGAGGRAEFHLLPAFGRDGHTIILSEDAARLWTPILEQFLLTHPQITAISPPPETNSR